jgi:hypothetical protein
MRGMSRKQRIFVVGRRMDSHLGAWNSHLDSVVPVGIEEIWLVVKVEIRGRQCLGRSEWLFERVAGALTGSAPKFSVWVEKNHEKP